MANGNYDETGIRLEFPRWSMLPQEVECLLLFKWVIIYLFVRWVELCNLSLKTLRCRIKRGQGTNQLHQEKSRSHKEAFQATPTKPG
ncbi:hypothetical protein NPIL_409021 [Nephila pilipes]|uniref:Uncharacterized protein n=1 Tax=Nephila pilipes TaxID=299642 RepID=A0A8X6UGU4_NEPPI|nr:hypothetical protein NPIL_409021 [Nephila pilipes]